MIMGSFAAAGEMYKATDVWQADCGMFSSLILMLSIGSN